MIRVLSLAMLLVSFSASGWAKDYVYQGEVEGMVCAFCAYNVSRKIGSLPYVDTESVEVDLKNKRVSFRASTSVSAEAITSVFEDSGFKVSNLTEIEVLPEAGKTESQVPILELNLHESNSDQFETVLEAIANVAFTNNSRLVIHAPESLEIQLLKPMLMGRKHAIKVQFLPTDIDAVHLQLFLVEGRE